MSDVLERFLRYVQVDSPADPHNEGQTPSSECQHALAAVLAEDLRALGCTSVEVTDHAYVIAHFPASEQDTHLEPLMLCSHIDTAPDAPGRNVHPHVVHYEGGSLVCGEVDGVVIETTIDQQPDLEQFIGQDIVCTDGTTLLGADDKAGVAEICSLLARLQAHPELRRPPLRIVFVPDEEIGHGAALLDIEALGARRGYTVDGEALGEFNYECFSAAAATLHIKGVMTHPGSAKNLMVNAIRLAGEFEQMIPAEQRPEHTEGREGFYHPLEISGTASEVTCSYIIRDFDSAALQKRIELMQSAAHLLNCRHETAEVHLSVQSQYRNMGEHILEQAPELIEYALEAHRDLGVEPTCVAVRGGTDGAQLTFRGLMCPNIATGGYAAHSVKEFIPVSSLEFTVDLLERLVAKFCECPERA